MNKKQITNLARMPLVAILRGITPAESVQVAGVLVDAGFYFIEITLDSPHWQQSIEKIATQYGDHILLGAGTVLSTQEVERVHAAGGHAIVSPNTSVEVIACSQSKGMVSVPGCYTPSECFTALAAGADVLKIFPANTLGADYLKSLAVVLPKDTRICPTGGVDAHNLQTYLAAGAFAVGIGAALYQPGIQLKKLHQSAIRLVAAVGG